MRSEKVDRALDSALKIRPGERRQVGLMLTYLTAAASAFILGRTTRDTLFLSRVDLEYLPLNYVLVAILVSLGAYAYGRIADHYRRDRLIQFALAGFSCVTFGMWALIRLRPEPWVYGLLYVLVELIGALTIIQFWTLATDVFSGRQGKRLFGVIGAGAVLANILCGVGISRLVPRIGAENLLLGVVALHLLCVLLVRWIGSYSPAELAAAVTPKGPKKKPLKLSPHLVSLGAMVVISFLTITVVDYQFKVLIRVSFPHEQAMAAYFGDFYLVTGIVASAVQLLLTSRLLERAGVIVALSILPVSLLVGAGLVIAIPLVTPLIAASVIRGAENVVRYTVHDSSMQLLYAPLPAQGRGRAKAFIDGVLKPLSIGVAGLSLWGLSQHIAPGPLVTQLAWADLGLVAAWLAVLGFGVRPKYLQALVETLRARRMDFASRWTPVLDETTHQVLQARLRSEDASEVLDALELLWTVEGDFLKELTTLCAHPSEAVQVQTLSLLGATGRLDASPLLRNAMISQSAAVRAAAVRGFCALGKDRSIFEARGFLNDPNAHVRAAAIASLIEYGGLDGILIAADGLKKLLGSAIAEERRHGAWVLKQIHLHSFFQPLLPLLQDPDPQVQVAAVQAAATMKSPALLPALIYKLADPATSAATVEALSAYGESASPLLFKVLANRSEDIHIRRQLPRVLEQLGTEDALSHMLTLLNTKDELLRLALARACARLRVKHPDLSCPEAPLQQALQDSLRRAYELTALIQDLQLPPRHLLPDAIGQRLRLLLELLFLLLLVRHPRRELQLAMSNLGSDHKLVRSNAIEVTDQLLSRDVARLLLPLLEQEDSAALRAGREHFGLPPRSHDHCVQRALDQAHPWTVACALHHLSERPRMEVQPGWTRKLRARSPLVRETALVTIARLCQQGHPPPMDPTELNLALRAAALAGPALAAAADRLRPLTDQLPLPSDLPEPTTADIEHAALQGGLRGLFGLPGGRPVVVHRERRVVGEALASVDVGGPHRGRQGRGDHLVVQAPPHVVVIGATPVGPPGVLLRRLRDRPERVPPALGAEQRVHPGPLLGQKAGVLLVLAPVFDVGLGVGDVPVPADHHLAPLGPQLAQVVTPPGQKLHLQGLPGLPRRPRGHVHRDHRQARVVELQVTPLPIPVRPAQLPHHPLGSVPAVDAHPAVAGFLGDHMIRVVKARRSGLLRHLIRAGPDLLGADHVGPLAVHPLKETLAGRGPHPVQVDADDPHAAPLSLRAR